MKFLCENLFTVLYEKLAIEKKDHTISFCLLTRLVKLNIFNDCSRSMLFKFHIHKRDYIAGKHDL